MIKNEKIGLLALGYVENIASCVKELSVIVAGNTQSINRAQLDQMVEEATKEFLNHAGYPSRDGQRVCEAEAMYIRFALPLRNSQGEIIYGWFQKSPDSNVFKGVSWGTSDDFKKYVKVARSFSIGRMYFDNYQQGQDFLDEIANAIIPETWEYNSRQSQIHHPILKSYLENTLNKLVKESRSDRPDKVVYSNNHKTALFNSNLLDKYFHDVLIAGRVEFYSTGEPLIHNPKMVKGGLTELGFDGTVTPQPPQYFEDVNDVIFQTSWVVERDFCTFEHIIDKRRNRFPLEHQGKASAVLASMLDRAIDMAVILAKRNHNIVAPMYRPQTDIIQLLMPIYLNGIYSDHPDFALILTPDKTHKIYKPETIIPLDPAYQNARLIAKPDESWLNPNKI